MVLNRKRMWIVTAFEIGLFMIGAVGTAKAGWPSGQWRTEPGAICTPFTIPIDASAAYCGYVSDLNNDVDAMDGFYNADIYADFHVSSTRNGGWTQVSACYQAYTGGSVVCGAASQEQDGITGAKDVWVSGFKNITGSRDGSDYYFVEIVTTETIDQIFGTAYGP
jgi:hypothetical protein